MSVRTSLDRPGGGLATRWRARKFGPRVDTGGCKLHFDYLKR